MTPDTSLTTLQDRLRDALPRLVNLAVQRADQPIPQLVHETAEYLFFEQLEAVTCGFSLDGEPQLQAWPARPAEAPRDDASLAPFGPGSRIARFASDGDHRWVVIRPERTPDPDADGLRWVRLDIRGALGADEVRLFDHLCRWTEWQKQLVALVEALWLRRRPDERQAVMAFDRVVAQLEDIVGGAHSLSSKLQRIVDQLQAFDRQEPAPTREFRARWAREAAEWAVQALHGSGWAQRPLDAESGWELCVDLASELDALAAAPRVAPSTAFKLRCLAVAIGVGGEPPAAPDAHDSQEALAWLLAAWTRKHGRARRRAEAFGAGLLDLGAFWRTLLARTRESLAAHLGRATADGALSPDWLRGWLLLELVDPLAERLAAPGAQHTGTWSLLADYAFLAREEVRRLLFGARPDFRVQPDALRASLAHLVVFHAQTRLGLPEGLDLRQLLTRLAEPRGGADGDPFAAGHLDHALYVYLAGQVALGLRFERPDGQQATLGALLAHDLGDEEAERLPRSFALAALFHDAGVQLSPRTLPPIPGLVPRHAELRLAPAEAPEGPGPLVTQCLADLSALGTFRDDDDALLRWLERRPAADPYTHEVLGAWCLALRAEWAPELEVKTRTAALRAILLHRAFTVPLAPRQEPTAWLLVLCDELVDWDPHVLDRRLGAPRGRTPRVLGGDLQPHRSRARGARLGGAVPHVEAGRLHLVMPLRATPRLEITVRLRADIGLAGRSQLVWLAAAQNLERLQRLVVGTGDAEVAVGPEVVFEMGLAGWRHDARFDTRAVLLEALPRFDHPARAAIHRWLASAQARIGVDDGTEHVRFLPEGRVLWHDDLRRVFGPLTRLCDTLLSERALLHAQAPQRG